MSTNAESPRLQHPDPIPALATILARGILRLRKLRFRADPPTENHAKIAADSLPERLEVPAETVLTV